MVSGHAILAETCTPPFICSQRFLSAYIPVPARDTWSTWRKSLVSWHDSLAETCFSSRYLQPVPPVGLLTGFSKGCNFYLEYVEKEPGDYIVLWWVDMIALQKPVNSIPLSAANASSWPTYRFQQWVQFLLGGRGEGAWRLKCAMVSRHDSHAETCFSSRCLQPLPPVGLLTNFSKGCNFCLEYVEKEPGDCIVLWWVDMIALQKPVSNSHPVICS